MEKKRRMTNRELARWLAQGNGEYFKTYTRMCYSQLIYDKADENDSCSQLIRIRAWDEDEWHEPLVEEEE